MSQINTPANKPIDYKLDFDLFSVKTNT